MFLTVTIVSLARPRAPTVSSSTIFRRGSHFKPVSTFGGALTHHSSGYSFGGDLRRPSLPMPLKLALLMTWRCHAVTRTLSLEVALDQGIASEDSTLDENQLITNIISIPIQYYSKYIIIFYTIQSNSTYIIQSYQIQSGTPNTPLKYF